MVQEYTLELIRARVAPAEAPFEQGIKLIDGKTAPFIVERGWSGPGGNYTEQWSIRRGGREVLYKSEEKLIFVRGIQSITAYKDQVDEPIELSPGDYNLVFIVGGMFMGSVEITASATETAAA